MGGEEVKERDVEQTAATWAVSFVCAMIILVYSFDLLQIMHKAATHVSVLKSLQWLMILGLILFSALLYVLGSVVKQMLSEQKLECRKLEMTLVSADSLPNVRRFGLMKVYAKVSITGESRTSKKTPPDMEGKINPKWNFPVDYVISVSTIKQSDINVTIKLFCQKTFREDTFIGEVKIPVKSLFDKGLRTDEIVSYQVGGTSNGRLNILYSFGETVLVQKPSKKGPGKRLEKGFPWRNMVKVLLGGVLHMLGDGDEDNDNDDGSDVRVISREVSVARANVEDDDDDDDDEKSVILYDEVINDKCVV